MVNSRLTQYSTFILPFIHNSRVYQKYPLNFSFLFLFEKLTYKTIRFIGLVLLTEMIRTGNDFKFEISVHFLNFIAECRWDVFVAFAEHEEAGHKFCWHWNRLIGKEESTVLAVVVDGWRERAFLTECVLERFDFLFRFNLERFKSLKIAQAEGQLWQLWHLEVETVPGHEELFDRREHRFLPDLQWWCAQHHIFVESVHVTHNISKSNQCSPVVSDENELLTTYRNM